MTPILDRSQFSKYQMTLVKKVPQLQAPPAPAAKPKEVVERSSILKPLSGHQVPVTSLARRAVSKSDLEKIVRVQTRPDTRKILVANTGITTAGRTARSRKQVQANVPAAKKVMTPNAAFPQFLPKKSSLDSPEKARPQTGCRSLCGGQEDGEGGSQRPGISSSEEGTCQGHCSEGTEGSPGDLAQGSRGSGQGVEASLRRQSSEGEQGYYLQREPPLGAPSQRGIPKDDSPPGEIPLFQREPAQGSQVQ